MLEEKFKNLGKYLAYDEMINTILDLKVKYHYEALEGKRSGREEVEIINALDILSSIVRDRKEVYLKKC